MIHCILHKVKRRDLPIFTAMRSSVLDADVNELCIRIMKRLIEKTQNDENISVNKNTIFEEVHNVSAGINAFESDNNALKERVFQELLVRGHIIQDNNSEKIKITSVGKEYPEYTTT